MRNLPADMLTLAAEIPPPEEWIIACLKMPSGDVWLSDRPVSAALLALLPVGADPLPIVEDWGTLDDGQGIDKILAAGSSGYLCAPKTRIVLIRADQTKSYVDSIISQGIHNRRIKLYRWFVGMTSVPVLIDTLFCQDRIELSESSMLFSFDAVGALASENPYMTDRANGNKNWPYLIGKAEGVPLVLLEEQSSKWTILLGDQEGKDIDEEYTGLIRVDDATKLNAGQHLINGEEVILAKASAGYMEITARARGGTEAQEHSNGSRIFPLNAVFKYAVCAGPIGSFDKLRTSNEIDIYDEDGDLDTTEYRDLYSGGNEEYHQELNPAQIWFNDRMPWLKKDQDYTITDKEFYGSFYSFSSAYYCKRQPEINRKSGRAGIEIPLQAFSGPTGTNAYQVTQLYLPSNQGAGTTFQASDSISDGRFSVVQNHGEWENGTAYTEFRANGTAAINDEGWMSVSIYEDRPKSEQYYNYTGNLYPLIGFVQVYCNKMVIDIEIIKVYKTGLESPWRQWVLVGNTVIPNTYYPHGYFFESPAITEFSSSNDLRFKFLIRVRDKADSSSFARVRIGGTYDGATSWYNMGLAWEYRKTEPLEWISSKFAKNLSSRGVFTGAKAVISGVVTNPNNRADGTVKIYENDIEVYSTGVNDGTEIDTTIDLSAATWVELSATTIKIELHLTTLNGDITSDTVKLTLTEGVKWLLSYTANNLDGLQVNYTDTLYVDAVSSRGANWTPAEAFKWLSEDKTSWAVDMLDLPAIDAIHAEYDAAGHYLNGLINSDRYQEAIKEIARQGFFLPFQDGGKISLQSYLSWPSTVSVSGDNDSLLEKSKTFEMTDTNSVIQRLIIDYNKNFSTGIFDGQHEVNTGEHVEQMNSINLDLVSSEGAVILLASWLFNIKSIQLKCFGFDGNFRLLPSQSWDKIELPIFLAGDLQAELVVTGIQQQFAQPKNDKPSKFIIKTIKV